MQVCTLIYTSFIYTMYEEWTKWMQDADSNLTPTGKVRKPTFGEVCSWVIKTWNDVKPEVIIKSFKKCGISNAMDGTARTMPFLNRVTPLMIMTKNWLIRRVMRNLMISMINKVIHY